MTAIIPEKAKENYAKKIVPMRRYGEPEEIAELIVAMCNPGLSYMNGSAVNCDGGLKANNAILPKRNWWVEEVPESKL